jgi:phosphatidate cytidylyltransferase
MSVTIKNRTNFQLRVVSGGVICALVLGATFLGALAFDILCIVMGALVFVEWRAMTKCHDDRLKRGFEIALAVVYAVILVGMPDALVILIIGMIVFCVFALRVFDYATHWLWIGFCYATIPVLALVHLRDIGDHGLYVIILLFAIVWATDIFAYCVGRFFGGPPLALRISPHKTISGAVGGTTAGILFGSGVAYAYGMLSLSIVPLIVVISVASQVGDLFESWVKRRFSVKDSGTIIPGHGGVMDRVDGLMFAAVVLYVITLFGCVI